MLIDFFKELKNNKNISIILTTHNIDIFRNICDDLIILKKGKIGKTVTGEELNEIEIESYF